VVETAQAAKLVLPAWTAGVVMVEIVMVEDGGDVQERGERWSSFSSPCLIVIWLRSNAWPLSSFVWPAVRVVRRVGGWRGDEVCL
jgi:hypothetical protein